MVALLVAAAAGADSAGVAPNAAAAIIVAVGTAIAAVAGVLRLRSHRNGTDTAGVKEQLVRLQARYDADRGDDTARMTRLEAKVDELLIALVRRPAPRGQRAPRD